MTSACVVTSTTAVQQIDLQILYRLMLISEFGILVPYKLTISMSTSGRLHICNSVRTNDIF